MRPLLSSATLSFEILDGCMFKKVSKPIHSC